MDPITLGPVLASQLAGLDKPVELLDPSGRKIGRFVPLLDLSGWVPLSPGITEEERERRKKLNEPGLTTAEAISYLGLDKQ